MLERHVLQPSSQFVISCDQRKVSIQAERLENTCIDTERYRWIALLDASQCFSRDAGTLSNRLSRIGASQPRLAQPIAKARQFALDSGQERGCDTWHNGQ